jgi:hypothetical protein
MRMRSEITLYPFSNVTHLKQLFCGFQLLSRKRMINLSWSFKGRALFRQSVKNEQDNAAYALMAQYDNRGLLCYDVHDSDRVIDNLYERCDFYFKRSFDAETHGRYAKMRPLGLNFPVDAPGIDLDGAFRAIMLSETPRRKAAEFLRALKLPPVFSATPALFDARLPDRAPPQILFLAQTWDPTQTLGQSPEKIRQREQLNEFRAAAIRALKREFPKQFLGGFSPTPYTLAAFRDLAIDDARLTRRGSYLALVDRYPICVTSRGLHDSTGWKFAEYLAKGRAIVTEKMRFASAGDLTAGRHYLDFTTPDECVACVRRLMEDGELRTGMMISNRQYYQAYVRPDTLVLNTLLAANGTSNQKEVA